MYTFVVGYMAGGDLYTILRAESVMGESRAKFIAASVILALEHLHALGFVYKDLKPENILMDQDGYIYLTDFGTCRSTSKNTYRTLEYTGKKIFGVSARGEIFTTNILKWLLVAWYLSIRDSIFVHSICRWHRWINFALHSKLSLGFPRKHKCISLLLRFY